MTDITNTGRVHELLAALGEQLAAAGQRYELVVAGGSALLALGLIERPTQDVDVVALRTANRLIKAEPLPAQIIAARGRVSRDFGVPVDWLNAGPAGLMDLGLPEGFIERLQIERFGEGLVVHFASRLDQIHFKLYALVDRGVGKHEQDLRALEPTRDELVRAARWTRTHDPSPAFAEQLEQALRYLGVDDADLAT
jgi:hypothetical protein